jgi:hypothetical protein
MEGEQAHELERIRMPGIEFKSPLAAALCVQMTPGSHVAEAGLVERIGGIPVGGARRGLRLAGSCPAFMTIHLLDPREPDINL